MRKPHINSLEHNMRTLVRQLCTLEFIRTGEMINDYADNEPEHGVWEERRREIENIVTAMGNRELARRCLSWR